MKTYPLRLPPEAFDLADQVQATVNLKRAAILRAATMHGLRAAVADPLIAAIRPGALSRPTLGTGL